MRPDEGIKADKKAATETPGAPRRSPWDWAPPSPHRCVRCGAIYLVKGWADRCPGCFLRAEGPS